MPSYWSCKCGHRNVRTASRKCGGCGELTKPKKRVPKHAEVLGNGYAPFVTAAREIHGVTDESCCVCGKPRPQEGHHDRDHGHRKGQPDYGKPRGLACGGNQGCNILMLPWITATVARAIANAKIIERAPDAERWMMIDGYLHRVEEFYAAS